MKYTREDFEQAKFAEHEDGRTARRVEADRGTVFAWSMEHEDGEEDYCADEYLVDHGWVPVPTKPTIVGKHVILESRVEQIAKNLDVNVWSAVAVIEAAFGEDSIIPDPEPTNTERLADILVESFNSMEFDLEDSFREIAAVLDKHGVTAPNVKGN